jgi:hypothetical protein
VTLLSILFGAGFTLASAWATGALLLRRHPAPPEIALALGAVIESAVVLVLLLTGLGYWWMFLIAGATPLVLAARTLRLGPARKPVERVRPTLAWLVFAPYTAWYFVNALAPETVADGITYHLGLPAEYIRLHGFPEHITFYGMIPQGMEMLYTMAFAFGRHSAAKLIEFAFFAATVPLIFRVGRQIGLTDLACLVAAVFYATAPVVGITGSSSYNDAAGVFFLLAAMYCATSGDALAGVFAGFCYAIKVPGLMVPAVVVLWFGVRRQWKLAGLAAAGAALVIAPWMVRDAALTGNPVAPLMNRLFPNPYFHVATESALAADLRSLGRVRPSQVPWELAFGDHLTGTFGALFFALPIGLLALGRREGRRLWAAAAIFALPWLTNSGARFLMPSVVLAALALGMVLPRPAACAAIVLQAVLCWPHVIDLWEKRFAFRLHEFPLAAALRLESEPDYLRRHLPEFNVVRMIQRATPPDARILALSSVAHAYLDRDVAVSWQSAEADQLLDTLRLASLYTTSPAFDWKASWPEQPVRVLRFRIPATYDGEWDISEIQLFSGEYRLFTSPQWSLNAWPNPWEAPLAFDANPATRWRTWQTVHAGMYFEVNLENPQRLTSAVLVTHTPVFRVPLEVYGQDAKGRWHLLSAAADAIPRPPTDLRLEAARAVRKAGFRYLLVPTGEGGNAPIGNLIAGRESEWGMERAGYAGDYQLYRVK